MKTLHIIRNMNDHFAKKIAGSGKKEKVAVLLIQDAVYEEMESDRMTVYACGDDCIARNVKNRYPVLSYQEIAKLVTEYDRTIVW